MRELLSIAIVVLVAALAQAEGPRVTYEAPPAVTVLVAPSCPGGCGNSCPCPAGNCPNCPIIARDGCPGCQPAEPRAGCQVQVRVGILARLFGRHHCH